MKKLVVACLLFVAGAGFLRSGTTSAQELEPIGLLPKLDADWELLADDPRPERKSKSPFRWSVFRNTRSGDLLALATHPDLGKGRALEYLSDTALEIFPNGRAVWDQAPVEAELTVIAMKVVDVGRVNALLKNEKLLEYCFVSEAPDRDNLMAQGRAWIGPKGAVFVQHTSGKPITSELVDRTITSIIQEQKKRGASESR